MLEMSGVKAAGETARAQVPPAPLRLFAVWFLARDAQCYQNWVSCHVRGKVPLVCFEA